MKKTITHKLFYVGQDYYSKSGSMIGVLYNEKWQRSDWGQVQGWLSAGHRVSIRKANKKEMAIVEEFYKHRVLDKALEGVKL